MFDLCLYENIMQTGDHNLQQEMGQRIKDVFGVEQLNLADIGKKTGRNCLDEYTSLQEISSQIFTEMEKNGRLREMFLQISRKNY